MKKLFLMTIIFGILLLTGSNNARNTQIFFTAISQIDENASGHIKQLPDYDSSYTICYKNRNDTYSLYIFASPIQYKNNKDEYAIIDNTVVVSNRNGFAFENKANSIKTYFPLLLSDSFRIEEGANYIEFKANLEVESFSEATQMVFTNMYGDRVSAVVYKHADMDIAFYPTKAGIKVEALLKVKPQSNSFVFVMKSSASNFENKENGYFLFKQDGINQNIVYQPHYMTDKNKKLDVNGQMDISQEGDKYLVIITLDESIIGNARIRFPIKLDASFEIYQNKIPDSTVYSEHDINNYLASYATIGDHPDLGEGWHYLRFRLNYVYGLRGVKILDASYNTRLLSGRYRGAPVDLYQIDQQWSSTGILWDARPIPNDIAYKKGVLRNKKTISFNIIKFVKNCYADDFWETESNGLLIKGRINTGSIIIATSDNSLYTPYIKLVTNGLPRSFEPKDNINPPVENIEDLSVMDKM